jgi:hypothetical protein
MDGRGGRIFHLDYFRSGLLVSTPNKTPSQKDRGGSGRNVNASASSD